MLWVCARRDAVGKRGGICIVLLRPNSTCHQHYHESSEVVPVQHFTKQAYYEIGIGRLLLQLCSFSVQFRGVKQVLLHHRGKVTAFLQHLLGRLVHCRKQYCQMCTQKSSRVFYINLSLSDTRCIGLRLRMQVRTPLPAPL